MNIYETIDFIKAKLGEGKDNPSDELYGYNIVTDPYSELSKKVPLILIEAEKTEFYNQAEYGTPTDLDHHLSFTVFEEAQKASFDIYKSKISIFAKKLIDKLMQIDDWHISKLVPTEMSHSEAVIGSLKVTGISIGIKVRTGWEEK